MKNLTVFILFFIAFAFLQMNLFSFNASENISMISFKQASIDSLILPVELIYFYAEVGLESVTLKWGTATEVNNFGFEIERAFNSTNGFEMIDFVLGNGTSNIPIDYEYTDTNLEQSGVYYYRLKQVDVIGDFEYSDTVMADFVTSVIIETSDMPDDFEISDNYPNPFNPSTKIDIKIPIHQFLKINLYNINGMLVKEIAAQEFSPGIYQLMLDFSGLSSGIYFIRFDSQINVITKRVVFIK